MFFNTSYLLKEVFELIPSGIFIKQRIFLNNLNNKRMLRVSLTLQCLKLDKLKKSVPIISNKADKWYYIKFLNFKKYFYTLQISLTYLNYEI